MKLLFVGAVSMSNDIKVRELVRLVLEENQAKQRFGS